MKFKPSKIPNEFDLRKNTVLKKLLSFNEIVPSKDLNGIEYSCFLDLAKPHELELDAVSQETYYKICRQLNKPIPKPNFPKSRLVGPS